MFLWSDVSELNCAVSSLSEFHHTPSKGIPLHMGLHIRNHPTQDILWFCDSIRPPLHVPQHAYPPQCIKFNAPVCLNVQFCEQSCRLSLCYSKTQSDTTDSLRRAAISPFGNTAAHQWQTRDSLKQIVGLLLRLKMENKKRLPTAPCSNEREEVLKEEKSHI